MSQNLPGCSKLIERLAIISLTRALDRSSKFWISAADGDRTLANEYAALLEGTG
jgi:hypothetical protein